MAEFKLSAGATLDLLTKPELDQSLAHEWDKALAERARGVKPMRYTGQPQFAIGTTTAFTVPYTPDSGYVWNLRSIACTLSTAANALFNLGTDTHTGIPTPNTLIPVGGSSPSALVTGESWGKGQYFIYPGEFIVISASASATLESYIMQVINVPAELAWKVC